MYIFAKDMLAVDKFFLDYFCNYLKQASPRAGANIPLMYRLIEKKSKAML